MSDPVPLIVYYPPGIHYYHYCHYCHDYCHDYCHCQERVSAALENPNLRETVEMCIKVN